MNDGDAKAKYAAEKKIDGGRKTCCCAARNSRRRTAQTTITRNTMRSLYEDTSYYLPSERTRVCIDTRRDRFCFDSPRRCHRGRDFNGGTRFPNGHQRVCVCENIFRMFVFVRAYEYGSDETG